MYIPLVRERVRVSGRDGEFVVVRTDYRREIAYLKSTSEDKKLLVEAPFRQLFAPWEQPHPEPPVRASQKTKTGPGQAEL